MPINRGPYNLLVDDDGTNTVGSVWNKAAIKDVILDPADVAYAPLISPALTGVPTAPTQAPGTNNTAIATTAFTQAAISAGVSVWNAVAYSAANFVGTGSMTWTVSAGNQVRYAYRLTGKTITVAFYLDSTTMGGTASNEVRVTMPAGATSKGWCGGFVWIGPGSAGGPGLIRGSPGNTYLSLFKADLTNYALATATIFNGTFTYEIT